MLDQITAEVAQQDLRYLAGFVVVAALVAARLYYGGERFNRIAWQPIRVFALPLLDKLAKRSLGDDWFAVYDVDDDELVAIINVPPEYIVEDLEAAGFIPEPLAALKADWTGRTEVASYAYHHGPKPFPGAPEWLRERQVHVTLFERGEGRSTAITAHDEFNSWRPDLWEAHYNGIDYRIEEGVERTAELLGLNHE